MPEPERNAITKARADIIEQIRNSKIYPEFCKNLMIENVGSHMCALSNAIACIELAARRAMHYIEEQASGKD